MNKIRLFTIGFTKKTAEEFFTKLKDAGVKRVIDIRLNNTSQLAGFAKSNDLRYFLKAICDIEYIHLPILAPTPEILADYKKNNGDWSHYETQFLALMRQRDIENQVPKDMLHDACLLCSEHKPQYCHRRLVAEYLKKQNSDIEVTHLE